MTEYFIPTATGTTQLVEKRSTFIGHVWPVESEAEARARIEEMKKKYHDARHNCWCYRLRDGGMERYSDDGEPQGTAGQPMLNVFQREEVTNVCCVVTRYFGGILLGTGGLVRAYTQSARDTLDAVGISVVRRWIRVAVSCPYAVFERMKLEVEAQHGVVSEVEYTDRVSIHALLPEGAVDGFAERVTELTAGGCVPEILGEAWNAVPRSL